MKKLITIFKILRHLKIDWIKPIKSQVLIYDNCRSDLILPYVEKYNPEILFVRREKWNVFALMRMLFHGEFSREGYEDSFIEIVNPKLIITVIDNSPRFLKLKMRHPERNVFFVQNGYRSYYEDLFEHLDSMPEAEREKLQVDKMFTFGQVISKEYKRYIKGSTIEIGSIKNNFIPISRDKNRKLVVFISQWHPHGFTMGGKAVSHQDFFVNTDTPILKSLKKFVDEQELELKIILRNVDLGEMRIQEEMYFKDILGKEIQFLGDKDPFSSYNSIDSAELVVSVDTTLGYESVCRGNKTVILAIRSQVIGMKSFSYAWPAKTPDVGDYYSNILDEEVFNNLFTNIFNLSQENWQKLVVSNKFDNILNYDPSNKIITQEINKILI